MDRHDRSLAWVRDAISTRADLPKQVQRDILSALNTMARVAGRPLDAISANVPDLRDLLASLRPAGHGVSPARWGNVRSLLAKSLDAAGVTAKPKRDRLSPEWESLLRDLPEKPHRIALVPFGRFCSHRAVAPGQVGQATFESYERHLQDSRLLSRPREVYLGAARAWNLAACDAASWPGFRVAIEDRRDLYLVDWSAFPASFKEEADRWIAVSLNPDPLDVSAAKPLRRASAQNRFRAIQAFASALVRSGSAPERLNTLAALVELGAVRQGLRWFMTRTGEKKSAYLKSFALLLLAIARHVVYRDDPDRGKSHIAELKRLSKAVDPGPKGMTGKNRDLLRNFDNDELHAALVALPDRIWRRHAKKLALKTPALVELQVALAIEILIRAPIRLQNLVSIRIDENFRTVGPPRSRRVYLYFPPHEVKNEVEIEFELSAPTITLVEQYLAEVRPQLIRRPSPFLFPSPRGGRKIPCVLSHQIADLTAAELGVRMTAHQFRHVAGHFYLKAVPGGHEVVRRLLGHKSIQTTLDFYAGMETMAAHKHYDGIISRSQAAQATGARRQKREVKHA